MIARTSALLLVAGALAAPSVCAQTRLADIKARGHLTCAAFPRPGLASEIKDGWTGLLPDLCKAVAVAALGPDAKFEFTGLELPNDAKALAEGAYDVLFLSEPEIAANALAGKIAPGPTAFFETYAIMVEDKSPAATIDDLAGAAVCYHEADTASQAFEERMEQKDKSFVPMAFQEDVELLDSYNSRHCTAIVSETTDLLDLRRRKGVNNFDSKLLGETLAVFPIVAATPLGDAQWAAGVAWVVHFLHAAERPQSKWLPGGDKAINLDLAALGLDRAWRQNVLAGVGDYGAIYARNLGEGSPYKLPRGVNAPWAAGGLFAPPTAF
ncbi:MAG TPA: hypothetical protein VMU18_06455 [Rhodoblastus sp.]|nr:hypothetical protein [Rhodoblastus sp.]